LQNSLFTSFDQVKAASPDNALSALIQRLPENLYLGTSSWSFPGWAGLVFADSHHQTELAQKGLLAYASHGLFDSVSLDRTYYAPLSEPELARYASQVPPQFRFIVKAGRELTEPRADNQRNPRFLNPDFAQTVMLDPTVSALGDRMGLFLLQFSPKSSDLLLRYEKLFHTRLKHFLSEIQIGFNICIEIRNQYLLNPGLLALLKAHRALPCISIHPKLPEIEKQLAMIQSNDWPGFYCRWNLGLKQSYDAAKHRYHPFNKLVDEDPVSRNAIAAKASEFLQAGKPVFITANNKAEGSAPLSIMKMAEAIDQHL